MPATFEELQALLRREDLSSTIMVAIELPREPNDGDPRCAMLFSGPEAYAALNLCIQIINGAQEVAEAKNARPEGVKLN